MTLPRPTPSTGQFRRVFERACHGASLRLGSSPWAAGLAAIFLVAVGGVVIAFTAADYGVAWDDAVQTRYGAMVLDYFLSGGVDRGYNELLDLRFYGPAVEMLGAALGRLAPHRLVETRHILSAAIALLSIPALYRFGRLLGNPWLGLLAAIVLWLSPRFYGHAFVNTKDIPFAVGMIASLGALAALFAHRRYRWREIVECGVLLGCTVAVRPGGWLLLGAMYVAGAVFADWQSRPAPAAMPPRPTRVEQRTLRKAVMFAIAWGIMVAFWPWAHESPLWHPLQAIRMSSKFHLVVPVLFDGQLLSSDALPRHYLLKYVIITTPLSVLALAAVGIVAGLAQLLRSPYRRRTTAYWMLFVWLGLPLLLFFVMRPNAYDGMRHFLFVLPAIALFAAIGIQAIAARLPGPRYRLAFALVLGLVSAAQVATIARLHPYQMAYFNRLVGGVAGATGRYDSEYWMTSYREAMEWIHIQPPRRDGAPLHVLVAGNESSRWCAEQYAGDNVRITTTRAFGQLGDLPDGYDYYLGTTRTMMSENFPDARVVKTVGRDHAVFAVVKCATAP